MENRASALAGNLSSKTVLVFGYTELHLNKHKPRKGWKAIISEGQRRRLRAQSGAFWVPGAGTEEGRWTEVSCCSLGVLV